MPLSLQLAHQLADKHILLVGGGEVALTRVQKLIPTGCKVTLVAPTIHPKILASYAPFVIDGSKESDIINNGWNKGMHQLYRIITTEFDDTHLSLYCEGGSRDSGWALILTCIPDAETSERIYRVAKEMFGNQQVVNVADNPPLCDVHFGANLEFGTGEHNGGDPVLQLMVSSNGASPRFSALVRDEIKRIFQDIDLEQCVKKLGLLRAKIRSIASDESELKYRMSWIRECTGIFGIRYCSDIDVDKLALLYKNMADNGRNLEFPSKECMLAEYTTH